LVLEIGLGLGLGLSSGLSLDFGLGLDLGLILDLGRLILELGVGLDPYIGRVLYENDNKNKLLF